MWRKRECREGGGYAGGGRPRPGSGGCRGLTLLELIICMAIMTLLAAASIPSFRNFTSGARVRGSAQSIVASLRAARRLAITQRVSRAVFIYMNTAAGISNAVSYYETADTIKLQYMGKNVYLLDVGGSNQMLTYTFNARGGVAVTPSNNPIRVVGPSDKYIEVTTITATGHTRMGQLEP